MFLPAVSSPKNTKPLRRKAMQEKSKETADKNPPRI